MNEKPVHKYFHFFMIWFALWAFAALAIAYGAGHIFYVTENGASHRTLDIVLSVLMIALGIFVIWTRFDLAAFRARAIKELLWACLAAAVLFLGLHGVEYLSAEDCYQGCVPKALILACWGIALYRYYGTRKEHFS